MVDDRTRLSADDESGDATEYEVRLGWSFASARLVIGAVAVGALGIVLPDDAWVSVIWVGLCAFAAALFLAGILRRPFVLRVDQHGITLGGNSAVGPQRITASVPWDELAAVVLFQRRTSAFTTARLIGLLRHDDRFEGRTAGLSNRLNASMFAHIPPAVANRAL